MSTSYHICTNKQTKHETTNVNRHIRPLVNYRYESLVNVGKMVTYNKVTHLHDIK